MAIDENSIANNISELLCVQMLCENEDLVKKLESEVKEHCDLVWMEICRYDQFQKSVETFNSDVDTSFSRLLTRAFDSAKSNTEIYYAIREIFFKIMFTCQQVIMCLNRTVRSIETVAIMLVSFYKYLEKSNKQQKAANCIFKHIKEFQFQNIDASVSDAVRKTQELLSFIEEIKASKPEHDINDKLYKLLQPVKIMHFCLYELSNTNYYMEMYYNILEDALIADSCIDADGNGDATWKNSITQKLFLKYFRSILATRLVCTDFSKNFEKLQENFRHMIYCLPKPICN